MSKRLQTVVDDELAEAVKKAAAAERRSVSEWIAFRLEEMFEYPEVEALKRSTVASASNTERCAHERTKKEPGAAGGLVKVCRDCDARGLG